VLTHDQQGELNTIMDSMTSRKVQGLRGVRTIRGAQDHQGLYDQQGALKDSTTFPGHNVHWLTPINTAAEPIV
jgi:hypothetical protein